MRGVTIDWRLCVRLISALALVFVAFAHRPLDARDGSLPTVSAYAFPDGSIPIICVTLPGDGGDQHATHVLLCDACLIAGSILVPVPADVAAIVPLPAKRRLLVAAAEPLLVRPAFPPAAPPQAPPLA